jgi:hypothetical protein
MSYERTCGECNKEAYCPRLPRYPRRCDDFLQRPATADELRAERDERAEAQTAAVYNFKSGYLGRWKSGVRLPNGGGWNLVVPCVHRDGDEGIE